MTTPEGSDPGTAYPGDGVEPIADHVVDTDVHISYNDEVRRAVASYMEPPYRNYTLHDGYQGHGWPKTQGGKRPFELMSVTEPGDVTGPLCDAIGVDEAILNVFATLDDVLKPDRAVAEMRAANDWFLDRFLDADGRFHGLLATAMCDPHAVAEEIDRLGSEDGVVGAMVSVCQEFNTAVGDPSYDVVYRALEDNDLTPVYHTTGIHRKAPVLREFEKTASFHALGPKWAAEHTATSLVFQGVPEKFPDLSFVVLEGGLGPWIPQLMARLNREYAQWRDELPLLEQSPEEYLRDSFYFSTQPVVEFGDADHMRRTIEMIGADSIVFSSDHPHYDFDTPGAVARLLSDLSDEDRTKVLSGNAREAFGI